jgi:hypothetical protein
MTATATKIQPEIEDGECVNCGVPEDEICERCGCDCGHGPDGLKLFGGPDSEYCPHGCKTAYGDGEETWAADEAQRRELEGWQA